MRWIEAKGRLFRDQSRKAPIVIINGDKGGVGKSMTARVIASLLASACSSIVCIDADARNGHLERYMEKSMAVLRTNIRLEAGFQAACTAIENARDEEAVVMDLPANIGDFIENANERIRRFASAVDRAIIHVWVASEEKDSIILFNRVCQMAAASQTVFVLNGRFAPALAEFKLWAGSETRKNFLENGGHEIFMPSLPIYPRTKIMEAQVPFHMSHMAQFDAIEAVDFEMWWENIEHHFEKLITVLEGI